MTPKEKAKELVLKFAFKGAQHEGEAKKFALIAVDEIMDAPNSKRNYSYMELIAEDAPDTSWFWNQFDDFWNDVKDEIEKLK
jgi:hypothetical protein